MRKDEKNNEKNNFMPALRIACCHTCDRNMPGAHSCCANERDGRKKYKSEKSKKKKILIVYYSQSGTTKKVAERIKKMTGADIYRIQTRKKYPTDYDKLVELGEKELEEGVRPELKNKRKSVKKYDTIILGYPIWHGDTPMAIRSFLEEYDWTGKKVIPFCTSGSSRPDTSFDHVAESAQGAEVLVGFWTAGSGMGNVETTVPAWLDGLGISWNGDKEEAKGTIMKITTGNTTFTATLADNSSVTALKELLKDGPLTIHMSDYGNMEKVGSIGTSLPRNDEQIPL